MEDISRLEKKVIKLREGLKRYLFNNIDAWGVVEVGEHTAKFEIEGVQFKVWSANEIEDRAFYDTTFLGVDLGDLKYSEDECRLLQLKIDEATSEVGNQRGLKMTSMSNDLFFSFDGIYGKVKFTGYNDSDWWLKYKPKTVKEDDNITWEIDWDKSTAIYKPEPEDTSDEPN